VAFVRAGRHKAKRCTKVAIHRTWERSNENVGFVMLQILNTLIELGLALGLVCNVPDHR
jgi:hypothetical protein